MMIEQIRNNIILEDEILYLDFTASGLAYGPIEERLQQILKNYANTHSEIGYNARKITKHYNRARESLKQTLNTGDDFYIIPCGTGATGAIKKFQELMGLYVPPATKKRYGIQPKSSELPLVIIGPFEHHSNEVSFREALCETIRIPLNSEETIDLDVLREVVQANSSRELFGSFAAASNVTGTINPIQEIYDIMKAHDGIVCFDAAASSPYMNLDARHYDVMFLSPHKLLGGPGSCGLLVIRKELCDCDEVPTFAGGGTVSYVSRASHTFQEDFETKEDAGTPGILQFIKAAMAYELRNEVGLQWIVAQEALLKQCFKTWVMKMENMKLYCRETHHKLAIFSFNIVDVDPYALAEVLSDQFHIQVRAGCSCAGPYGHDLLGYQDNEHFMVKPGWIRIGFHYTHTCEDVEYFFKSLQASVAMLTRPSVAENS